MHIFPLYRKQMDGKINLDRLCSDNDFMQIASHRRQFEMYIYKTDSTTLKLH